MKVKNKKRFLSRNYFFSSGITKGTMVRIRHKIPKNIIHIPSVSLIGNRYSKPTINKIIPTTKIIQAFMNFLPCFDINNIFVGII
nr:MAG: hypothetical protein [uncultured archaeon]